jgi:hypothetical protein
MSSSRKRQGDRPPVELHPVEARGVQAQHAQPRLLVAPLHEHLGEAASMPFSQSNEAHAAGAGGWLGWCAACCGGLVQSLMDVVLPFG